MFAAPFFNLFEQGVNYLFVIDEVDKSETDGLNTSALVCHMVDDTGDCAHGLVVAICHPRLRFAEIECGIAFRTKCVDFVENQRRDVAVVAFVVIYAEFY